MKLSNNFTLEEMVMAGSARAVGDDAQFNLSPELINNLRNLCVFCLEPIRSYINLRYGTGQGGPDIPLIILSGYRSKKVNDYVCGAKKSYHLKAMACDFICKFGGSLRNDVIFEAINILEIPFTQLIREFGKYNNPLWCHLAIDDNNVKFERLRAVLQGKKTIYLKD